MLFSHIILQQHLFKQHPIFISTKTHWASSPGSVPSDQLQQDISNFKNCLNVTEEKITKASKLSKECTQTEMPVHVQFPLLASLLGP